MNLGSLIGYLGLDTSEWDKGLGDAQGKLKDFASKGVVAAAAAGTAIAGAVAGAVVAGMNIEAANDKLSAQLGVTGEQAEQYGRIAGSLYANAYGGSLEEVNTALRGVIQSGAVMEDASSAQIEGVTAKVLDLATAFDQDLGATTTAVGQMIRTGLAADADQALDIITRGMQQGADASGDLLDTFVEYPALFQRLGVDGQTAMGLIEQGMSNGARNADLVGDALKEFQIRATDGSKTSAAGFDALGLSASKMTAQIAGGGAGASAGLDLVLDRLRGMEDPVERNAAAVALFGTQAEDLGSALFALDPSSAVQALGDVEGAAAKMGATLNDNASTNLESFKRQATEAFVNVIGGQVLPKVSEIASTLTTQFGPALSAVAGFMASTLLPAAQSLFGFLAEHQTTVTVLASLIGGVLAAAFISWGVSATVAAASSVAAWVSAQAAAIASVAAQTAAVARVIASWVMMAAAAAVSFGQTLVLMGMYAAQSIASAASATAAWVAAQVRTVASLVVMAAGFVAQGAVMVATAAATAASVVAGWVLMATQSLIQAARMAAAWFIALGPVGWVIAAVVGLVALIVANWDTVVKWTQVAWSAVSAAVTVAWNWIKSTVSGAVAAVTGAISGAWNSVTSWTSNAWNRVTSIISDAWSSARNAVSNGISGVISFVASLPGKILGALGNMGSLLYSAGSDLLLGMVRGITGVVGRVVDAAVSAAKSAVNSVKSFLGIASPSKVFHGLGVNVGEGFANGIAAMSSTVSAEAARMVAIPSYITSAAAAADYWENAVAAHPAGYVQAEDGSWVPPSFHNRTATPAASPSLQGLSVTGRLALEPDGFVRIVDGRLEDLHMAQTRR
jgi:hypothetical protein